MTKTRLKSEFSSIRRICVESRLESKPGGLNRELRGCINPEKDIK